jgi:hypothetical protein
VWLVAEYRAQESREQLAQMSRQGTVSPFPAFPILAGRSAKQVAGSFSTPEAILTFVLTSDHAAHPN